MSRLNAIFEDNNANDNHHDDDPPNHMIQSKPSREEDTSIYRDQSHHHSPKHHRTDSYGSKIGEFIRSRSEDSDDWSAVSSLASSMDFNDKQIRDLFHRENESVVSTTRSETNSQRLTRIQRQEALLERIARFEQEQEELFQQQKHSLQMKLSNVLERSDLKTQRESKEFIEHYMNQLEAERISMVAKWKAEMLEEQFNRNPTKELLAELYDACLRPCVTSIMAFLANAEVFISNMPLTCAALGVSWVSMGAVWFKFMEENNSQCSQVMYYSPNCTFPEFPGCFECDTTDSTYRTVLAFHEVCSFIAGFWCLILILKTILAWNVVMDELSNPATATPCGVFCAAMICVFAGRGDFGETVVLVVTFGQLCFSFWFLYMAIAKYRLLPDPGWFPNTVGIGYGAVKTFLYFPVVGDALMTLCMIYFVMTFFLSVIRVFFNPKIAAPICWFQISSPSITLYASTLILQPSPKQVFEFDADPEKLAQFEYHMKKYYLPAQTVLMILGLVGLLSAVHGVSTRWHKFKTIPFSPAHLAFCAPTLSHANAVQAYRSTVIAYGTLSSDASFMTILYAYWCVLLVVGTVVNLIFTFMFVMHLPEWTKLDVAGEEEPPGPEETILHGMLGESGARDTMYKNLVNPAVLQANETGALIRVRRGTEDYRRFGPYKRTRQVTFRGFDPRMNETELRQERAELLDWVAKNAPRKRSHTMSVPGVMHLVGEDGNGIYGSIPGVDTTEAIRASRHARSKTSIGIDNTWQL